MEMERGDRVEDSSGLINVRDRAEWDNALALGMVTVNKWLKTNQ